jgi:hypothetical protein
LSRPSVASGAAVAGLHWPLKRGSCKAAERTQSSSRPEPLAAFQTEIKIVEVRDWRIGKAGKSSTTENQQFTRKTGHLIARTGKKRRLSKTSLDLFLAISYSAPINQTHRLSSS